MGPIGKARASNTILGWAELDAGRLDSVREHHHFSDDVAMLAYFKSHDLTSEDCQALVYARELGRIDNKALLNLSGVDTLPASRSLRRLRDEGLLEQKGKGSVTYYVPTPYLTAEQGEDLGKPSELGEAKPLLE